MSMTDTTTYTVGRLAEIAGVTVRTLHHYDRIGLLRAPDRSEGGYRRYGPADLERLHRILSYRELGLSLDAIAELLDEPQADAVDHLRRQEGLLRDRIGRLEDMLAAVKARSQAHELGIGITPEEQFELFGDFDAVRHAREARERWGATDAYAESTRRTAAYSKEDWKGLGEEVDGIQRELVALMREGVAPDDDRAMDLAEQLRLHVSRWFYDCSHVMHRGLADLYVSDERFTAHYESLAEGLAAFVHEAIHANADRAEGVEPAA